MKFSHGMILVAGVVALLGACAGQPPAGKAEAEGWKGVATADPMLVSAGEGSDKKSPLAGAPPLSQVLDGYEDDEVLAYRFIEGMRVGHNEMPLFNFDVRGADALIAYLRSIRS